MQEINTGGICSSSKVSNVPFPNREPSATTRIPSSTTSIPISVPIASRPLPQAYVIAHDGIPISSPIALPIKHNHHHHSASEIYEQQSYYKPSSPRQVMRNSVPAFSSSSHLIRNQDSHPQNHQGSLAAMKPPRSYVPRPDISVAYESPSAVAAATILAQKAFSRKRLRTEMESNHNSLSASTGIPASMTFSSSSPCSSIDSLSLLSGPNRKSNYNVLAVSMVEGKRPTVSEPMARIRQNFFPEVAESLEDEEEEACFQDTADSDYMDRDYWKAARLRLDDGLEGNQDLYDGKASNAASKRMTSRQRQLERNRLAAARCRTRKKAEIEDLRKTAEKQTREIKNLEAEKSILMNDLNKALKALGDAGIQFSGPSFAIVNAAAAAVGIKNANSNITMSNSLESAHKNQQVEENSDSGDEERDSGLSMGKSSKSHQDKKADLEVVKVKEIPDHGRKQESALERYINRPHGIPKFTTFIPFQTSRLSHSCSSAAGMTSVCNVKLSDPLAVISGENGKGIKCAKSHSSVAIVPGTNSLTNAILSKLKPIGPPILHKVTENDRARLRKSPSVESKQGGGLLSVKGQRVTISSNSEYDLDQDSKYPIEPPFPVECSSSNSGSSSSSSSNQSDNSSNNSNNEDYNNITSPGSSERLCSLNEDFSPCTFATNSCNNNEITVAGAGNRNNVMSIESLLQANVSASQISS